MNQFAPILLFVYNRPRHTEMVLDSLLQNSEAQLSDLFIYADGCSGSTTPEVESVRKIIQSISGFKSITITIREKNWGLAKNIISGVTEVINKYQKVIVLEDDLIVSPYFLKFMNDALITYEHENRVGHIQACDFTNDARLPDNFLIKWTGSWGWATWKRAWDKFEPNGELLLSRLKRSKRSKEFDFGGAYPYTKMLKKQTKGLNNSWAIRWNASLFLEDILSLNVGKSLVLNTGFDGTGTHCGSQNIYKSQLWNQPLIIEKINPIKENEQAKKILAQYYKKTNSLWAKGVRRLQKMFNV